MKKQTLDKNLKQVKSFRWFGDDETMTVKQFIEALNKLPYHYWVRVHNEVVDSCQDLISVVDFEYRDELTGVGERNFDSLFKDYCLFLPEEDRSDEGIDWHPVRECWEEAEEYLW